MCVLLSPLSVWDCYDMPWIYRIGDFPNYFIVINHASIVIMAKKKMKCGSCGNDKHTIYLKGNGNVIVKCTQCKNQSEIKPVPVELAIINHKGDGCICVMPKN